MAIISGEDLEFLSERFEAELKSDVQLRFFTRASFSSPEALAKAAAAQANQVEDDTGEIFTAEAARVTGQILAELATIAPDYIQVETLDLDSSEGQAAAQSVGLDGEMLPAIVYTNENLKGRSRYFGLPSGYEFGSLVENIVDLSSGALALKPGTLQKLTEVRQPVSIMVFVTPT